MNKPVYLILILLTACQPVQNIDDDFIKVSQSQWTVMDNIKPYPFTVEYGEIACTINKVYFFPDDTANDESQLGWPLNRLAEIGLKEANLKTTIANPVIPNADLSEAIKIGLDHCEKVKLRVANFNS